MRVAVALVILALAASPAWAQQRNGNIYNGTAHEPAASDVTEQERAAGLLQPEQKRHRENQDVESLGDKVLRQSRETLPKDPPKTVVEPGK